jgi:hypothetical protein
MDSDYRRLSCPHSVRLAAFIPIILGVCFIIVNPRISFFIFTVDLVLRIPDCNLT